MKKNFLFLFVLTAVAFVLNAQEAQIFRQEGIASWYGREFDGRPTASGEIFDASQLTAAHPTLPFGTMLVVTNQHNNKSVTVRINDRGPFVPARIIDVSRAAAELLDMIVTGTAPVIIESTDRIAISYFSAVTQVAPQILQALPVTPVVETQVVPQAPTAFAGSFAAAAESPAPAVQPAASPVIVSQPVIIQPPASPIRLTPQINITPEKNYRLQVGSYRIERNAVDAFERLRVAGLNPSYERFTSADNISFYRVVVANVRGTDVLLITERISAAGFAEALIREEN